MHYVSVITGTLKLMLLVTLQTEPRTRHLVRYQGKTKAVGCQGKTDTKTGKKDALRLSSCLKDYITTYGLH